MLSEGSVTHWLDALKAGDPQAAQCLWERYFGQLLHLARSRIRGAPRQAADEEDVALSAFDSFCRGVERGRFPQLLDRDNLWRLLVVITSRKAIDFIHHGNRQKRGPAAAHPPEDLEQLLSREPDPAFATLMAEECRRLLNDLGQAELRTIALAKMEGFTNAEIAGRLGCARRTVERKLELIRILWAREGAA